MLVIDDEPSILHAFRRTFERDEIDVLTATSGHDGLNLFRSHRPDVVIVDLRLPDQSGLDCFAVMRSIDARIPVIFITGHGTVETAIEATKQGAYDYLFKPLDLASLRQLVEKAFELSRMIRVQPTVPGTNDSTNEPYDQTSDSIIGRCESMRAVYAAVGRVAGQDLSVLIQGESGTGKELIARAVYHHSGRNAKPFRAINCAAIPDTLLESEIFGHERAAFTGAERQRIGKIEQTNGGTLFLDEVGELSPLAQAKLLRVLQDGSFERVGGNATLTVDVRIVAATNHDLKRLVSEKLFRADLYFRLSVVTIELPPLRERGHDLHELATYFVRRYAPLMGKSITLVPDETVTVLRQYPWPGNVRELESVIRQSLLTARGTTLLPEFLPPLTQFLGSGPTDGPDLSWISAYVDQKFAAGASDLLNEMTHLTERRLIEDVLSHTGGNQLRAAAVLGISRVTLRSKIRLLGIDITRF